MKKLCEGLLIVLTVLMVIIFLPFILIIALFSRLVHVPKEKKEYRQSRYFQDLGVRYRYEITQTPGYLFYNSAVKRNLPITYHRQENGLEYFVYNDTVYLFPDDNILDFDEDSGNWEFSNHTEWSNFQDEFSKKRSMLKNVGSSVSVKMLLTRKMIVRPKLTDVELPEQVCVVNQYETAFDDEKVIMDLPQNSQELYDMMHAMENLCGHYELHENVIHWKLYDEVHLEIDVQEDRGTISVEKGSLGITHWHTEDYEVFHDVCAIGKPGHVMVIRAGILGATVLYMGSKEDCPYPENKKGLFGKIYYLESK